MAREEDDGFQQLLRRFEEHFLDVAQYIRDKDLICSELEEKGVGDVGNHGLENYVHVLDEGMESNPSNGRLFHKSIVRLIAYLTCGHAHNGIYFSTYMSLR